MINSELQTIPAASFEDLDEERLRAFAESVAPQTKQISIEDLVCQFRFGTTMGTRHVPTLAGLYLFGRHPDWMLPQSSVVAAKFDGIEIGDNVTKHCHVGGHLEQLMRETIEFVEQNSREVIDQLNPTARGIEFARISLREALVNALIHRDLSSGGPVNVRIFDDRLEIWSPGAAAALQHPLQYYAQSQGGVTLPRNPVVAMTARHMGLGEQMGRGLALVHLNSPGVQFTNSKDGVKVIIPSQLHSSSTIAAN